jgi:hypothetical protein
MNFSTHQLELYIWMQTGIVAYYYMFIIYIYMHSQLSYLDLIGSIWNLNGIKQQTIYVWFTIEIETTKNK